MTKEVIYVNYARRLASSVHHVISSSHLFYNVLQFFSIHHLSFNIIYDVFSDHTKVSCLYVVKYIYLFPILISGLAILPRPPFKQISARTLYLASDIKANSKLLHHKENQKSPGVGLASGKA